MGAQIYSVSRLAWIIYQEIAKKEKRELETIQDEALQNF